MPRRPTSEWFRWNDSSGSTSPSALAPPSPSPVATSPPWSHPPALMRWIGEPGAFLAEREEVGDRLGREVGEQLEREPPDHASVEADL